MAQGREHAKEAVEITRRLKHLRGEKISLRSLQILPLPPASHSSFATCFSRSACHPLLQMRVTGVSRCFCSSFGIAVRRSRQLSVRVSVNVLVPLGLEDLSGYRLSASAEGLSQEAAAELLRPSKTARASPSPSALNKAVSASLRAHEAALMSKEGQAVRLAFTWTGTLNMALHFMHSGLRLRSGRAERGGHAPSSLAASAAPSTCPPSLETNPHATNPYPPRRVLCAGDSFSIDAFDDDTTKTESCVLKNLT
eukprot:6208878-Pleurochrysis_carterae.AAC.1